MNKLRYKSDDRKDVVVINTQKCTMNQMDRLAHQFYIKGPIPHYIEIEFFIYKKKSSWIKCNGVQIDFKYDIKPITRYSEPFVEDPEKDWQLIFLVNEVWNINVSVNDSCYPKKVLIKHLLNRLFAREEKNANDLSKNKAFVHSTGG